MTSFLYCCYGPTRTSNVFVCRRCVLCVVGATGFNLFTFIICRACRLGYKIRNQNYENVYTKTNLLRGRSQIMYSKKYPAIPVSIFPGLCVLLNCVYLHFTYADWRQIKIKHSIINFSVFVAFFFVFFAVCYHLIRWRS